MIMVEKCHAVIMAGGRGERFWPLSTKTSPKPFLPLFGRKTMIQETVERIGLIIPRERILIVLSQDHLPTARQQLPEIPAHNFLVEPTGKDTAACIGLASLHIEKRAQDGTMLVLAADHSISDQDSFVATVTSTLSFIEEYDYITTIGIKPTHAETGYGYIEVGEEITTCDNHTFCKAARFVEKPDEPTAVRYLKSQKHLWNSGIFVWRNKTIQESIAESMPELWEGLTRIKDCMGSSEEVKVMREEFSQFKRISIDYGVLEKSSRVAVVPALFCWDDLGTWDALRRVLTPDEDSNVCIGRHVGKDTSNCIVYSKNQVIATFGVKDLIVVQAEGKLLVCHKEKAPFLKEIVGLAEEMEGGTKKDS
jgi:mannose-1-phosphate guanylyltransferase